MITIVDDDPSVRRAIKRLLRSLGHDVEAFASAQEYFDREHQGNSECLILDVHLGGMSGFDLQKKLIETGISLPIIFITAHDDDETRRKAVNCGASAYLVKPFDDQALIHAIQLATHRP